MRSHKKQKFDGAQELRQDTQERKREAAEKALDRSQVNCPDCGAWLEITSSQPLPDDIKIRFVKHRI